MFTYGQTASGKTHTMKGSPQDPGLIPRTLEQVFKPAPEFRSRFSVSAKMSYYEVYNEAVNDLLCSSNKNLEVREDKELGVFVKDLTQSELQDHRAALALL